MPDKTKTIVVIESHQQTIVRRSRRTVIAQTVTLPPERTVQEKRKSLGRWWKTVALKTATVLAPLSSRLKTRANERKNRLS
jgi:hypothetical protein